MIEYTSGDILQCEADALVNTVNCVGVMGRGIALQFKNVYPENFKAYEAACKREAVQPGRRGGRDVAGQGGVVDVQQQRQQAQHPALAGGHRLQGALQAAGIDGQKALAQLGEDLAVDAVLELRLDRLV